MMKWSNFILACFWGLKSGRLQILPLGGAGGGAQVLQQKQIRRKISKETWEAVKSVGLCGKFLPYFSWKTKCLKTKVFWPNPWVFQCLNFWTVKEELFLGTIDQKKSPWNEFPFSLHLNCLLYYSTNSSFFLFLKKQTIHIALIPRFRRPLCCGYSLSSSTLKFSTKLQCSEAII